MRKNDLVKLNAAKCFTVQNGGKLTFPLSNHLNDEEGTVEGMRLATDKDHKAWRNSEASQGMDCAGETKLPPTAFRVLLKRDQVYHLLRARCRPSWSYRHHPGMAMVLCPESGHEVYIKRELLEVVS